MGKARDLFKKIRDTKGTFQGKVGTIKDGNGMDLIETEDIKKRWPQKAATLFPLPFSCHFQPCSTGRGRAEARKI